MKKSISLLLLLCLLTTLCAFSVSAATTSPVSEDTVRFLGRWTDDSNGHSMNWPLSGIEFSFEGTGAEVYISRKTGTVYANICIDGEEQPDRMKINSTGWVTLAEGLPQGTHTISFTRSSEAWSGKLSVSQVRTTGTSGPVATQEKDRKIMFVGDSYTAGYGNMASEGEVVDYTDAWTAWAGYASRALNADAHVIAYAGKGILNGRNHLTMPEEFECADCITGSEERVPWDHSLYQPQVIVIFLGTNDGGYGIDEFCNAYVDFLENMRKNYPNAAIVCCGKPDYTGGGAQEILGHRQTSCAQRVVQEMGGAAEKFYSLSLTSFKASGIGSHPLASEQKAMADQLTQMLLGIDELWGETAEGFQLSRQDGEARAEVSVTNLESTEKSYSLFVYALEEQDGVKQLKDATVTTQVIPAGQSAKITANLPDDTAEVKASVVETASLRPLLPAASLARWGAVYQGSEEDEEGKVVSVYRVDGFPPEAALGPQGAVYLGNEVGEDGTEISVFRIDGFDSEDRE